MALGHAVDDVGQVGLGKNMGQTTILSVCGVCVCGDQRKRGLSRILPRITASADEIARWPGSLQRSFADGNEIVDVNLQSA
jgi:hypothetical protein